MNQIKCPNCGEVFTIDESSYDSIVRQIRDHQFEEELKRREKEYNDKLETELKLVKTRTESENMRALSEKDRIIEQLKFELSGKDKENELVTRDALDQVKKQLQEKEREILELNGKLVNKDTENELKLSQALQKKDAQILELKAMSEA